MHDLENLLCFVGDFYGQLNKLSTCFAFLLHSTSTLPCSTVSMDSPDWFNNCFVRVHEFFISVTTLLWNHDKVLTKIDLHSCPILPVVVFVDAENCIVCILASVNECLHSDSQDQGLHLGTKRYSIQWPVKSPILGKPSNSNGLTY